ncbi:hypothetical protein M419DRAFT_12971 [Trichoderma reesei RUT C-30]|uniref:Uncharacterized protein n=1 Tax=Hypocrea jecorina (strain ATCC 56765 / BCRC 32924 / NRRL 11460 / Rut C-30) TaxID=1344414 RepID=A0A024RVS6_HYPJR|nr:hypothetical protein M419DRAFT_12971 [Trichoderma reesei RUT C-30]
MGAFRQWQRQLHAVSLSVILYRAIPDPLSQGNPCRAPQPSWSSTLSIHGPRLGAWLIDFGSSAPNRPRVDSPCSTLSANHPRTAWRCVEQRPALAVRRRPGCGVIGRELTIRTLSGNPSWTSSEPASSGSQGQSLVDVADPAGLPA